MIFVSVGSMLPFERLVEGMDAWAAAHPDEPVAIQIGNGTYEPRHAEWLRIMPPGEYRRRVREARLFVAHAGMGSIISAIEAARPLLMLPRLKRLGEHNTDHQLHTAASIGARPGLHVVQSIEEMHRRIDALLADGGEPPAPIAPFAEPALIERVRGFIHAGAR